MFQLIDYLQKKIMTYSEQGKYPYPRCYVKTRLKTLNSKKMHAFERNHLKKMPACLKFSQCAINLNT